ncbi:metallophosphoesterase, partial [bacterium]|nr:metallophosphoesterase [bacterium]
MAASLIIVIIFIIIFFGLSSLIWYAFRFEVTNFQIKDRTIYLKSKKDTGNSDLKRNAAENNISNSDISKPSLKILHLSDFHLRTDFKGQKLVSFIKILSIDIYDFIFITGDMVERDNIQDELIRTLKPLKAKYGIYAVFGAHDYYNKKP